jgi:hypothetical protein
VKNLFEAFGKPAPAPEMLQRFANVYEPTTNEEHLARYAMVFDGELYDGKRIKYISKERVVAEQLEQKTRMFHSELAAVRAKVLSAISGRELVGELGKRIRRRVVG